MSRWTIPLLLAYCGILFFHGLATGELYRTEGLRGRIAQECWQSGNWVVPTLYNQPLFTKPPGMYSAIGLASAPFGQITDWSARLPSALSATALVLLFYWFFRRYFGEKGGVVAALLLPLSPVWLERVPTAEIDTLQTFWVGAAILFFLRATEDDAIAWWLLALLCVAGGFLTKWTAPAFFYMTVVPLVIWRGEWRLLFRASHLFAWFIAVAVCVGWGVAAGMTAGWDILYQTVSDEALQHLSPAHQHEPYPWAETLSFPFRILAANLPLSAFALWTLRPGFAAGWNEAQRRVLQAMHCWVWPSLLFWSIIPGHAVRHSMPLSPGLAGLAAIVWIGWLRSAALRGGMGYCRSRFCEASLTALVVLWLGVKVVHVQFVVPPRTAERQPATKGELLAALVPSDETLYLVGVKDEGLMFYYGRVVQRLPNFRCLPSTGEPVYCILTDAEWRGWPASRPAELIRRMTDQQGDPLLLVQVSTDGAILRTDWRTGPQGQ